MACQVAKWYTSIRLPNGVSQLDTEQPPPLGGTHHFEDGNHNRGTYGVVRKYKGRDVVIKTVYKQFKKNRNGEWKLHCPQDVYVALKLKNVIAPGILDIYSIENVRVGLCHIVKKRINQNARILKQIQDMTYELVVPEDFLFDALFTTRPNEGHILFPRNQYLEMNDEINAITSAQPTLALCARFDIAMDYYKHTLRASFVQGLPLETKRRIVELVKTQLCTMYEDTGLEFIYTDMKLGNVAVSDETCKHVYVIDFGSFYNEREYCVETYKVPLSPNRGDTGMRAHCLHGVWSLYILTRCLFEGDDGKNTLRLDMPERYTSFEGFAGKTNEFKDIKRNYIDKNEYVASLNAYMNDIFTPYFDSKVPPHDGAQAHAKGGNPQHQSSWGRQQQSKSSPDSRSKPHDSQNAYNYNPPLYASLGDDEDDDEDDDETSTDQAAAHAAEDAANQAAEGAEGVADAQVANGDAEGAPQIGGDAQQSVDDEIEEGELSTEDDDNDANVLNAFLDTRKLFIEALYTYRLSIAGKMHAKLNDFSFAVFTHYGTPSSVDINHMIHTVPPKPKTHTSQKQELDGVFKPLLADWRFKIASIPITPDSTVIEQWKNMAAMYYRIYYSR